MVRKAWAVPVAVLAWWLVGCSPAAPVDQPPKTVTQPPPPTTPSAVASPAPTPSAEPPPPVAPLPTGKIAKETLPAGLNPITESEAEEANTKCKPLSEAMKTAVDKAEKDKVKSKDKKRYQLMMEFLAQPPKIKGVDEKRCADLIKRDMEVSRAVTLEGEAIQHLTQIAVSLKDAYSQQPKMCPQAGPTPADLTALQDKSIPSKPEDWAAEGWKCARFSPGPNVRFQYELKTDPKNLTYEIIARGYPVKGGAASELFLPGRLGPSAPDKPSPVFRR